VPRVHAQVVPPTSPQPAHASASGNSRAHTLTILR
jgi:hypothetical protein